MPLYEFKCKACDKKFEEVQRVSDPPLFFCTSCRGPVERKFWDWDDKLLEFRQYTKVISQAPILPYFFVSYLVVLLFVGLLGGGVYRGILGFLGMIVFALSLSGASLVGGVPIIGPFLYLFWLGPWVERLIVYHFGLQITLLSTAILWTAFSISVLLTVFSSLYIVYRLHTPLLFAFLAAGDQEKFKFLLVTRLLNYEMTPLWFYPGGFRANLIARILGIQEFPAIRLMGKTYYSREIPVGPIRALEERRETMLKKASLS